MFYCWSIYEFKDFKQLFNLKLLTEMHKLFNEIFIDFDTQEVTD